jgi:outer membrane receptor protein involved in Fe transport
MVNDPYNYAVRVEIPNNAIEEVSVQTGGFNAEYGESMSGVIMTTTKSGSEHYFGGVQLISDGFLSSYNKMLGTYSYDYNEYLANVGGPIYPGSKHTFFFSGLRKWQGDNTPSWGWAENKDKPQDLHRAVIDGNQNSIWSATGKLRFQIGNSMQLIGSGTWTDRVFGATNPLFAYDVEHAPEMSTTNFTLNATFIHTLSANMFYEVRLNYFDTYREKYDRMFHGKLGMYGDPNYNGNDPNDDSKWGEMYYGSYKPDLYKPGVQYNDFYKNRTTYYGGDIAFTYQYGKHHKFKAGAGYKYHTMRFYRALNPVKFASKASLGDLERYRAVDIINFGYDLTGHEVNDGDYLEDVVRNVSGTPISGYDKQKPYNPIIANLYIQDKVELGDLVLNLGLRVDYIDPNAWQFKQMEAKFDADGNYIPGTGAFGGDGIFDKSDIKDSESYVYLSPRLGFSFPITTTTVFYAQFGKFYQPPQLGNLYLSPFYLDRWVNAGGYFTTMNNPNLKPPRTTSYEIGFKKQLSDYAAFQVTTFYKETEDLTQVIPVQTDVTNIAFTNNGDFGVIRGLDIMLNVRGFNHFSARLAYELQYASGTGSQTGSNFNIAWQSGGAGNYPKLTMPLDFEQRHTGSVNIDFRLGDNEGGKVFKNSGANLLFQFNSGRPYTRKAIINGIPFTGRYEDYPSEIPVSSINTELTPWNSRFDLRLDKGFNISFGNMENSFTISLWVYNLFNTGNVMNVWSSTGLPDNTGYLFTQAGQTTWKDYSDKEKKMYMVREMDYNNYGMPRQMRLGLKWNF